MVVPRNVGVEGCRGLGVTAGLGSSLPAALSAAALGGCVLPPPPCTEPPQGLLMSHAWEQDGCQSSAGAAGVRAGGNGAGSVTCSTGRGGGSTKRETRGGTCVPTAPWKQHPTSLNYTSVWLRPFIVVAG